MRKYFISLLLFFSASALAVDTFDETTNILKIDAVVVEGIQYNNVVLRLYGFDVISVGSSAPVDDGTVAEKCSDANFTLAKYNAITEGMTVAQVNRIIGCKTFNPSIFESHVTRVWYYLNKGIVVYFDSTTGNIVKAYPGTRVFKTRVGFL